MNKLCSEEKENTNTEDQLNYSGVCALHHTEPAADVLTVLVQTAAKTTLPSGGENRQRPGAAAGEQVRFK